MTASVPLDQIEAVEGRADCLNELSLPFALTGASRIAENHATMLFGFHLHACVQCSYVYPDTRPSPNKVANDHLYGYTDRQRVFMSLSGAASFTGAVSVVFAAKGKYSNYSFGIINATLYGLFAWYYGYGGDAQMNVLFFNVMQLIGMYTWQRNLNADKTAIVRSLKWWHWIIAVVVAVGLSVAFYYEIPVFVGTCSCLSAVDSTT